DDSFASDRPSNLDVDYNETLYDSFTGDRPSNLDVGSDEPSNSEWDNATNPTTTPTDPVSTSESILEAPAPPLAAVSHDTATNDHLVEPKRSLTNREGSNGSVGDDSSVAGGRTSVDDSFARGSLDNAYDDVEDPTADEDVSFRMSGPAGDYMDDDNNDDSFMGGESSISYSEAAGDATSNKASSSFEDPGSSGFYDASRAFDQEFDYGNAEIRQSNRGDMVDLYSRESTGSAASLSASSYDNQQSFFVGSMGSEAEALSFLPMASSPAFSDVVMLGDESETGKSHESSSLDLQSLAVRTSGSEGDNSGAFSPREEPPLLPVTIKASTTTSPGVSAVIRDSSTAAALAAAPRSSFIIANESLALSSSSMGQDSDSIAQAFSFSRKSGSSETLGDSFMRDSNQQSVQDADSSFMEDNSFRLSSPNGAVRASEQIDEDSFVSESSFAGDDSFSSVNFSEVAARHMERRSSEMSHDSKGKRDAQAGAPASSSPSPANSQPLASSPPGGEAQAERQTDELLDFTGVYRDSVQSSENARVSLESRNTVVRLESKVRDPSLRLTATAVSLVRARSDSIQRASERKVEDFFRRTYNFNKDDEDLNFGDTQNRRTRARTTVEFNVHMEEDEEQQVYHDKPFMTDAARQRSKSTSVKKTIGLRSLRADSSVAFALAGSSGAGAGFAPATRSRAVSRPSTRLQIKEDLLEVAPSERRSRLTFRSSGDSSSSIDTTEGHALEEKMQELEASRIRQNSAAANEMSSSRVIQRNFTISISSETRSSNSIRDDSPNMIPMPPHYMLSPKTESPIKMSSTSVFAFSKGLGESRGGKDNGNDNSTATPTLPGLSMATASSLTPSPFSASYAASSSSKMPQSHLAQSGGGMAPGFKWNTQEQLQHLESRSDESGGMSIKESIWHETRPTLSDQVATHFQRFSSSLRNTLQRTGVRFFGHQPRGGGDPNQTTSPQSVCSAPPKLSRKFDDKNFYVRFGRGGGVEDNDEVIAAKQALGRNRNPENVFKKRHARTMVTLLCALLGVALGIGVIHVESLSGSFNLPRAQQLLQQQLQPVVGGLKIATATQWILLPGKLFLRLWNCVTLPLLFCHILNGIADMAMNQKAGLVLSFRSIGYMLCVSLITTLEGVGVAAAIKSLGLFKASAGTSNASTKASAAALRKALGVVDRRNGSVALMCESSHTYLQSTSGGKTFRCSNDSIPLPVYEVITNGTAVESPAIFVFNDVNNFLKTAGTDTQSPLRYYPQAQSLNDASKQLVNSLVPANVVDSLISSTPMSTVAIALLLGLVCGKRAWERGIHAKNGDFADSRIELAGEHVADKPHYILGVFVELQLALEWLADVLETLAPIGVLSLLAGNIVLHRQELMTIVEPMMQLVLSVVVVCLVHVLLVVPLFMKLCFKVNMFASWSAFLPAYLMCFCTGSVVLSLPIVQQCYEKGNIVTKSMAQVAMGMLSVLHRNAHALYYPVAILWLLQTSTQASDIELTTKMCVTIGFLTLASCFFALHPVASVVSGTHGGSNLFVIVTLWRAVLTFSGNPGTTSTPPTFPLLVACDVLLSRFIAVMNLHDNLVVTRMIAEHCDEVVVEGTAKPPVNSVDFAPSPMYI
ncbi:Transmembrane protein, partial [Globisporangium polare]